MARIKYKQVVRDALGNISVGADVEVRRADGGLVTLYVAASGSSTKSNPTETDTAGAFEFWVEEADQGPCNITVGSGASEATFPVVIGANIALPSDLTYRGGWDASGGTFPTSTSAGEYWDVETGGTVDGVAFSIGQQVVALVDGASTTTYAGNWFRRDLSVWLTKADVGLGNVDNTSDADKPVSTAQQAALDAKADEASPTLTGDGTAENLTASGFLGVTDGTVTATFKVVDGVPSLMGQTFALDEGFAPFAVTTPDGYTLLGVGQNGDVSVAGLTFGIDPFAPLAVRTENGYTLFGVDEKGVVSLPGAKLGLDPFTTFSVTTSDGYSLIDFDRFGASRGALSPDRIALTGPVDLIDGEPCAGAVSQVTKYGDIGYHLDGPDYTGPVVVRATGDWAAPHMVDAPVVDVWEADGQSWQTISDYTPDEMDYEETSGDTSAAITSLVTPMVVAMRDEADVGVVLADGSRVGLFDSISDGDLPGEFHRLDLVGGFTTAQAAAVARSRFQRRMGLPRNPTCVLNVGWPGTSSEKFLPEGASYSYTDDDGVSQTTTAAEHPTAGAYLWANNILTRDAMAEFLADRWINRQFRYEFLSWIQGPFDDYGNATGFMGEYRDQQDALSIPDQSGARHILWDQNGGTTHIALSPKGYQAAVDFCQANASGSDWLVGPRYPHKLRDYIHHSSFGALEYAERTGQAAAYVQAYGAWEPLWITDVSFSGADVTITTNRPRQCTGDLVQDAEIDTTANGGWSLWDVDGDSEIAISSVTVSGNTITLTAGATLSGNIEVGYAVRGAANSDGTVSAPQWSATTGNIKMVGRDAPAIIPASVQPTLDHWLCKHRKTYSV